MQQEVRKPSFYKPSDHLQYEKNNNDILQLIKKTLQ